MTLIEKILALKDRFRDLRADPHDVNTIGSWEAEAKRLFLLQSLKGHDGIKYVLEIFRSEVSKITEKIDKSYSKDLPDKERDRLLDKRDLAQRYLNLFEHIEDDISKLEEAVDRENI